MKKLSAILLFAVCLFVVGCSGMKIAEKDVKYTVRFVVDDSTYSIAEVTEGECVKKPSNPTKNNYIFMGWMAGSSSYAEEYDFSQKVSKDMSLYARFTIDAAKVTNEITTNYIHGIFTVYAQETSDFDLFDLFPSNGRSGSGICFHKQNGYCYILTNCHVAGQHDDGWSMSSSYKVEDYKGNTYTAYIYKGKNKPSSAVRPEYDLACLYFKTSVDYPVISFASSDPKSGTDVVALGTPKGQKNSIAFGKIKGKANITLSDTDKKLSNVTFDVLKHSAFIDNGSSGGALLNASCRLVGVNYASSNDGTAHYSIPIEKVREFLDKYVWI